MHFSKFKSQDIKIGFNFTVQHHKMWTLVFDNFVKLNIEIRTSINIIKIQLIQIFKCIILQEN